MSVQNAGAVIREARLKAGLSQEKLSEGICSTLSLSRIETGAAGGSPSTFKALMSHAGTPCEAFPTFASRSDFDCFYALKRARFYIDCWQLEDAYAVLTEIEENNFSKNKFYYQEWLLLYCNLQFRSNCPNHQEIYTLLQEALYISRPDMNVTDFKNLLLSTNEIELLLAISQEAFSLKIYNVSLLICTQLFTYLTNSQLSTFEQGSLLAKNTIVYVKHLLKDKDYYHALENADKYRQLAIKNSNDASLHELTFLTGLSHFHLGHLEKAYEHFKAAFFSLHSLKSYFSTIIMDYLEKTLDVPILLNATLIVNKINRHIYPLKKIINYSNFTDGIYDPFSPATLTIGNLIQELRLVDCKLIG